MTNYFLGANSRRGFSSLYQEFPPDGAYLHILKAGPGTGKSTLLRKIAAAAEIRGLTVERVLCSGDPESLDAVYLPALGQAWADGTAPHAMEPLLVGVTGDYCNLGSFLKDPISGEEKQYLLCLHADYGLLYREAYQALAPCAEDWTEASSLPGDRELTSCLASITPQEGKPRIRRFFLRAVSCQGYLDLPLPEKYQSIQVSPTALRTGVGVARARGLDHALCPWPLDPEEPDTLLLPQRMLAFRAEREPGPRGQKQLEEAIDLLGRAKTLHDQMEAVYRQHMDFTALSAYTEELIEDLGL